MAACIASLIDSNRRHGFSGKEGLYQKGGSPLGA
jgi:hypothetical protein